MLISSTALKDTGTYQCMLGAIVSSDLVKDTRSIAVTVARQAELELEGEMEEPWVVVEGEEVTVTCAARGGTPAPDIVGHLGTQELWEEEREETEDVVVTFSFTPERADRGKKVKCSAEQKDEEGGVLFGGGQEIMKEVRRKLQDKSRPSCLFCDEECANY